MYTQFEAFIVALRALARAFGMTDPPVLDRQGLHPILDELNDENFGIVQEIMLVLFVQQAP